MTDQMKELLIQRCVDGELSDVERAELLQKLDATGSTEAWRTLALSFVEGQILAGSFPDPVGNFSPEGERSSNPARRVAWYRRQIHPLVSVAAALCVGFITGIIGHVEQEGPTSNISNASARVAASPAGARTIAVSPVAARNPSRAGQPVPVMNVNLTGMGKQAHEPVTVPVYSPEQWGSLPEARTPIVIPDEVQRQLREQGYELDHQRQWFRAPLNDGREILVPTETVRVRSNVQ
jgi:hypothetical protein